MRPSFHPRLVNSPTGDPGVLVPLTFRKRSLLFDLGDLSALSPGDILKITHIFVSHTHVDHFIGFDQVLRLHLGRPHVLHLFGPEGFLDQVAGKLSAYSWNLVHNYQEALVFKVAEIREDRLITRLFDSRQRFIPTPPKEMQPCPMAVLKEPEFQVNAVILDHQIPCLAFSITERFHVNILKAHLDDLGLDTGPWLAEFKTLLYQGVDPKTQISVPRRGPGQTSRSFKIGPLAEKIAKISPGQKVSYVTDVLYSRSNEEKIIQLAMNSDQFFIEAAFLEKDAAVARAKHHLTAHQAGIIARKARVRKLITFHYSPRYAGETHRLDEEAQQAFQTGIDALPWPAHPIS
jgi:ribonuclease Z